MNFTFVHTVQCLGVALVLVSSPVARFDSGLDGPKGTGECSASNDGKQELSQGDERMHERRASDGVVPIPSSMTASIQLQSRVLGRRCGGELRHNDQSWSTMIVGKVGT